MKISLTKLWQQQFHVLDSEVFEPSGSCHIHGIRKRYHGWGNHLD